MRAMSKAHRTRLGIVLLIQVIAFVVLAFTGYSINRNRPTVSIDFSALKSNGALIGVGDNSAGQLSGVS